MNELDKKKELDTNQIEKIRTVLIHKAHDWVFSGGRECDGIEVFRTQNEEIFMIRDVATGVEIGMRKEVRNEGVITHLSFFVIKDQPEENADNADVTDGHVS